MKHLTHILLLACLPFFAQAQNAGHYSYLRYYFFGNMTLYLHISFIFCTFAANFDAISCKNRSEIHAKS